VKINCPGKGGEEPQGHSVPISLARHKELSQGRLLNHNLLISSVNSGFMTSATGSFHSQEITFLQRKMILLSQTWSASADQLYVACCLKRAGELVAQVSLPG
jgi:hypothetical protein